MSTSLPTAPLASSNDLAVLDAVTHAYAQRGATMKVRGLTGHSAERDDRHAGQLAGSH